LGVVPQRRGKSESERKEEKEKEKKKRKTKMKTQGEARCKEQERATHDWFSCFRTRFIYNLEIISIIITTTTFASVTSGDRCPFPLSLSLSLSLSLNLLIS
jgi:hypothetical protein